MARVKYLSVMAQVGLKVERVDVWRVEGLDLIEPAVNLLAEVRTIARGPREVLEGPSGGHVLTNEEADCQEGRESNSLFGSKPGNACRCNRSSEFIQLHLPQNDLASFDTFWFD